MTTTGHRRFRKVGSSALVALVTAATCLAISVPTASAAVPTIVNAAVSPGVGATPSWLESNTITTNNRSTTGASSDQLGTDFVVQHDPGRTVTGLAIDQNWDAVDDTATVTPTAVTSTQVPGGISNYSTVRYNFTPGDMPGFRGTTVACLLTGNGDRQSFPIKFRAVLDDGTRTAPVSTTLQQVQEAGCGGAADYPTAYNATQTATSVAPGGTVTFTFAVDDPDGTFLDTSNNAARRYRWRVRRLNDGAITSGPTCAPTGTGTGSIDGLTQTLSNVPFAQRGRYVVEVEIGSNEAALCTVSNGGTFENGGQFFRVGTVDVNTAAATSPTLTLTGAPGLVQAGLGYTVTANTADSDTGGRVQAIDWDADGIAGNERRVIADETVGITTADRTQAVTTTVGQCADRTVTAHVVDNGMMNGSDPVPGEKTVSALTVVNCAPVASDVQTVGTSEDTPQSFTLAPTDGDGDPLTYSVVTNTAHGTVSGSYPSFAYNPDANFNGTDTLVYNVNDGKGASDNGKVTFNVSAVNDAPTAADLTVSTPEDTPKVVDLNPSVSDPDEPGQTLTVSIVTGPSTGVATVTGATEITYTPNPPANFNGVVSIVYQVDDGQGLANSTDTATLTINVDPVDDAPVAADQATTTPEDTSKTLTLGPTTDVDGETVTYSVPPALQPANGTVTVVGTSATYQPFADYFGPDDFHFQATDGNSVTTGHVTVDVTAVNDAPVALDQSVSTLEDNALPITLSATDVDNTPDQLTYTVIAGPTHGTLDTTSGASLVYTPNLNYNGPDSLTFSVTDGALTDTASITITVIPVNDPPVADDGHADTTEDNPVPVLLTASDVDNTQAQLSYTVTVPPQFGTLSGSGANLVYTPNLNYNGSDGFAFQVSDGDLTDDGAVTIDIGATNDPPTAIPQSIATPEDTALPITLDATDPDDATSALSFAVLSGPSHGTLDTTTGPALSYTPSTDYNGYDAFVFQVTDPSGANDVATVVIAVGDPGTNDPPTADDQAVTTPEDTDKGIVLTGSDVDGDALTYSIEVAPSHGTATISNDVVLYSPNLNYHGSDLVVFKVDDGHGGIGFGSVDLTVTSVNDAPDAIPAAVELVEDTPTPITLTGTDVDGDPITFAVTSGPSHGTLTGTGAHRVYTPAHDYFGNDAFTFSATDSHGASTTAEISLVVDAAPKTVTSMYAEPAVVTILHNGVALKISIPLTAHLTNKVTGAGIAGKTVLFSSGTNALLNTCTAVTDSTGTARCTVLSSSLSAILNLGYNAFFAGDEDNLAVSDAGTLIRIINVRVP